MAASIVVGGRAFLADEAVEAQAHLEDARALIAKAGAFGGRLVAWAGREVAFAFEADADEEALTFAADLARVEGARPWAVGVAQGELLPLEGGDPRARLAFGAALTHAQRLARMARPGEVLLHEGVGALVRGEVTTAGGRLRRDEGLRLRGVRLDVHTPFRRDAAAQARRVAAPAFIGRDRLAPLLAEPGTVGVLAAESGLGGSRFLQELLRAVTPAPAILLEPVGLGFEPLASLRRALDRVSRQEPARIPYDHAQSLERLFAGQGVDADTAATLLIAALRPMPGAPPTALLAIDDADVVDEETLAACARAFSRAVSPFLFVVRSDDGELPPALEGLPRGAVVHLEALSRSEGEGFASACLGGALTKEAQRRWARRGGYTPLGIVEALTDGLARGELFWSGARAAPRDRAAGKGRPRDATEWARERLQLVGADVRPVLTALALLGGEATVQRLQLFLGALEIRVDIAAARAPLEADGWLRVPDDRVYALPSRAHRRAILSRLDPSLADKWHSIAAEVVAAEGMPLALADAAHHALKARLGPRARELARATATAAHQCQLYEAASRFSMLARTVDRQLPAVSAPATDVFEELPTKEFHVTALRGSDRAPSETTAAAPPLSMPPPSGSSGPVSSDLSATPLLGGSILPPAGDELSRDTEPFGIAAFAPQEPKTRADGRRRVPPPRPTNGGGEGRAPQLDELQRLRQAKAAAETAGSPAVLCQACVALGVALAAADRVEEALLEGLEALARAREEDNERGATAALAFLAKTFHQAERPDEARRLELSLRRSLSDRPHPPF